MTTSCITLSLRTAVAWIILNYMFLSILCYGVEYDPIAIYLTWTKKPASTMTICWITDPNRVDDSIEFHQDGQDQWMIVKGSHSAFPQKLPYTLHKAEISNLQPNSVYLFRTGSDATTYKFKTAPDTLKSDLCFVVGGDMYHDNLKDLSATNLQAGKTQPLFALVGGDIAYATGKGLMNLFIGQKFDRWLDWLKAWKKEMVTPEGCLIPMLPVLGNHDVNGGFDQSPSEAPFFYFLFPMPGPKGYNVLDFGDYMTIILLDSGHTHSIEGNQTAWLEEILKKRRAIPNKFALYHVPAYPSVRSFENTYSTQIRKCWVPIFDRYSLTAAFENHDHDYKRTFLLRDGQINNKGVLYMGDGAWGVEHPRQSPKDKRWYIDKTVSSRHFIKIVLQPGTRQVSAITPEGAVLDEFSW